MTESNKETALAVVVGLAMAMALFGSYSAYRDLDACRAELAAVRDSLRVERAWHAGPDSIYHNVLLLPPDSLDWSKFDTYQIFGRGVRRDSFPGDTVRAVRVVAWP